MKELPLVLRCLAVRVIVAGGVLYAGFTLIDIHFIAHIPLLILLASIIVARPLAQLFAAPSGWLFFPNHHYDRPQPIYGIPEARRKAGQLELAMDGYSAIVAEHPQEIKAWINLMEIALIDLGDPARADAIYQKGIQTLKEPADREQLATLYTVFLSRHKPPAP